MKEYYSKQASSSYEGIGRSIAGSLLSDAVKSLRPNTYKKIAIYTGLALLTAGYVLNSCEREEAPQPTLGIEANLNE